MKSPTLLRSLARRVLPAVALALPAVLALAQQPGSPTRTARIELAQGQVGFSPSGENDWTSVQPSRPLVQGDRLWTDRDARTGVDLGNALLRLDGQTRLDVHTLESRAAQLVVMQGSVNARLRKLAPEENFEIDTPNLAFRASRPGQFRVDVDTARGTTRVTVLSGAGVAYGGDGEPLPIPAGRQIVFTGQDLSQVSSLQSPKADGFDRWVASLEPQPSRPAFALSPPPAAPAPPVAHVVIQAQQSFIPQPIGRAVEIPSAYPPRNVVLPQQAYPAPAPGWGTPRRIPRGYWQDGS